MENTMLKERLAAKNEVVLSEKNFVALEQNSLEIIRENLKNQPLSLGLFDVVKSPSGGSTVFSVPGISSENKACAGCPFNDFGSRDGESSAKACKESVVIFLLRQNSIMPLVVRVPASSKRIFQRYVTRLVGRMMPLSSVVTRITLEKKTNKSGQAYAAYCFEAIDELEPSEARSAREFGKQFAEMMKTSEVQTA